MRRTAFFALLVVIGAVTCAPTPRFGSLRFGSRPFHLETRGEVIELESGLRVALMPDDRTNLVRVDVRYRVGAAEDPIGRSGMAHLIEHLTFELRSEAGTPSVAETLVDAALVHNAYTTHDVTHYFEIGLADPARLVLVDLTLPDGDGLAVIEPLRQSGSDIFVALTGHDDPETAERCRAAGCVDVLLKPVPARDLLAKVRGWLQD